VLVPDAERSEVFLRAGGGIVTDYQAKVDQAARVIIRAFFAEEKLTHPNGIVRYGSYAWFAPATSRLHAWAWHGEPAGMPGVGQDSLWIKALQN
jgi:hypothetical protein